MASRLKATLEREFKDAEIDLVEGSGGIFEIDVDGKRVFSKKKLGRFPEDGEVEREIRSLSSKH